MSGKPPIIKDEQRRFVAMHGEEARLAMRHRLKSDGSAEKFIHVEAPVHDELGIFYTNGDSGGFFAVVEIDPVSIVGVSPENRLYNRRRVAAILDSLPPEVTTHSIYDFAGESVNPLPVDWYNDFLAEQEQNRNEENTNQTNWVGKYYIGLEWKGDFSIGGYVGFWDMIAAGIGWSKTGFSKEVSKRKEASRHRYSFLAYFKPDMQIRRVMFDQILGEIQKFNRCVDDFVAALTSEATGVGAQKDFGSLVEQLNAPNKIMVQARRLNCDEAMQAMGILVEPLPERRKAYRMPSKANEDLRYGLYHILGQQETDFSYLLSIAQGHNGDIKDPDLRFLGECGPYLVGGVPRQIVAVRSIPRKGLTDDLFASLRAAKIPFTVRVRRSGLTKMASAEWIKKMVKARKSNARDEEEGLQAEAEGRRIIEGIDNEEGNVGVGSILIAINGVPRWDEDGKFLSGSRVLRMGLEAIRKWGVENQILVDFLNKDQNLAHYSMLPGAWHLDPLEQIPLRSLVMGKLLPLYSPSPKMPLNTSFPGEPILVIKDMEGQIIERSLEVLSLGSGAICGGMGMGKSYLFADIMANFHKNEGRRSKGEKRDICIDTFEFGKGDEDGSSFNTITRLLGGRVIQFGKSALSDCLNPWDAPVIIKDGVLHGYDGSTMNSLVELLVTMAGGKAEDGGPVTSDIELAFKMATIELGRVPAGSLAGKVRCLTNLAQMIHHEGAARLLADWLDPYSLGKYFPSEADTTRARVVNYNFVLNMDPKIRAVLLTAVMSRISERGFDSGPEVPKLMLGDEVGQGLKRLSKAEDDAVAEGGRRSIEGMFTNGRRFGLRPFVAFQQPAQILDMGATLAATIRNLSTTYFLGTQTDEEGAKSLFGISDAYLKELKSLPEHHFGLIEGGQLTMGKSVNGTYGHAARTTHPKERPLRTAMMECGRWGVHGVDLDLASMTRQMADHLRDIRTNYSGEGRAKRFEELIRGYETEARNRRMQAVAKEMAQ